MAAGQVRFKRFAERLIVGGEPAEQSAARHETALDAPWRPRLAFKRSFELDSYDPARREAPT
jgi:hypothetical protein